MNSNAVLCVCDVLPNPVVLAWRHCSKPPPRTLAQPCREPPPHLSPPGSGCCTCSRCSAWLRRSRLRRHHNACVLAVQALAASDRQPTAADPRAEEWSMAHINMANNCEACTTGYSKGARSMVYSISFDVGSRRFPHDLSCFSTLALVIPPELASGSAPAAS